MEAIPYQEHDLIDIGQIAKMAETDVETVKKWMAEPGFPPSEFKLETGDLYDRLAVDKYLLETFKRPLPPVR